VKREFTPFIVPPTVTALPDVILEIAPSFDHKEEVVVQIDIEKTSKAIISRAR
jgi:hypothetical protein